MVAVGGGVPLENLPTAVDFQPEVTSESIYISVIFTGGGELLCP